MKPIKDKKEIEVSTCCEAEKTYVSQFWSCGKCRLPFIPKAEERKVDGSEFRKGIENSADIKSPMVYPHPATPEETLGEKPFEKAEEESWAGLKIFRDNLDKICRLSKYDFCPGCGLTVEALDNLLLQKEKEVRAEMVEIVEGMRKTTNMEYDTADPVQMRNRGIEYGYNSALDDIKTNLLSKGGE